MLKNVKAMILQKNEFLEAAQILFEDSTESNIDDLIILGESANDLPKDDEEDDDDDKGEKGEGQEEDDLEDNEGHEDDDDQELGADLNNLPLDGDDDGDDKDKDTGGDEDLLDASIDGDGEIQPSLSDTDDLPAVSGDPANDDVEDFLNITLDLRSNTITDILPVPPSNAAEAIASDDIMNTRIDSGFGDETPAPGAVVPLEEDDMLNESIDDEGTEEAAEKSQEKQAKKDDLKESVDNFLEGISLDGSGAGADEVPPTDVGGTAAAEAPAATEGESEVTSAVRDKVSEADEPVEGGEMSNPKDELLKKLGSITKNLEDAKKAVMNTIQ